MMRRNRSSASPESTAWRTRLLASASFDATPASTSIRPASASESSSRSAGPCPFKTSIDSITSFAFPIARPSGESILVITASVRTPDACPIATSDSASRRESDSVFMNAPLPVFTSRTSASIPSAIFLLMIEALISGMLSTVPVTSRSE